MDNPIQSLEWSLIASFLAVAEEGSLSSAARALDLTQPTVGRHIKHMEETLGFALFDRQPRGLKLTDQGASLIAPAQAMRAAAHQFQLAAAGNDNDMRGTVRITASEFTAHFIVPETLARLRDSHPEIQLELVPTDSSENLLFREADIALRMYRTEQLEIVQRKIGDLPIGIVAAKTFIQRHGAPTTLEDVFALPFVGYDRSELILKGMRQAGFDVGREWFPVRCDHHPVYFQLVRAGCGVGFAQAKIAAQDPALEVLLPGVEIPPMPLFIAAHENVRRVPRVAVVWEALVEGLKPFVS